jgi:hypothetical protein
MRVLLAGSNAAQLRNDVGLETLYDLISDGLITSEFIKGVGWVIRFTDAGKEALK